MQFISKKNIPLKAKDLSFEGELKGSWANAALYAFRDPCPVNFCLYSQKLELSLSFVYSGSRPLVLIPQQSFEKDSWSDGEVVIVEGSDSISIVPNGAWSIGSGFQEVAKNFTYAYKSDEAVEFCFKTLSFVADWILSQAPASLSVSGWSMDSVLGLASYAAVSESMDLTKSLNISKDVSDQNRKILHGYLKNVFGSDYRMLLRDCEPSDTVSLEQFFASLSLPLKRSYAAWLSRYGDLVPKSLWG